VPSGAQANQTLVRRERRPAAMLAVDLALEDMKFSFSRINTYQSCPRQFYLQYIECKPQFDNCYAEYGTLCHSVLEKYAKGELEVYELLDDYMNRFDTEITQTFPPNQYVDLREKYYNQGYDYFENFAGFDEYEILDVEKKFEFEIKPSNNKPYKFTGIIDLIAKDADGNLIIIDHKSKTMFKRKYACGTCGKSYSHETAEKRNFACTKKCNGTLTEDKSEAKEYLRQLYLYALAICPEYKGTPKKLIFNFFRDGVMYETDFNEKDYAEAATWVVDTIETIRNDENFTPKKTDYYCDQICGVRYECPHSNVYTGGVDNIC
jgi:ATP-dependent exoDNAse (exonuclease V) beta subunit